jgi:hypothetical protein
MGRVSILHHRKNGNDLSPVCRLEARLAAAKNNGEDGMA